MSRLFTRLGLVGLVMILALSATAVLAQDDAMMMEHGTIVCDEDLILSLYTAEYHFDYAAVFDTIMANGTEPGFGLNDFDPGQFAPLFDSMMTMMDESMGMGMTSEEQMTGLVDMMSMSMEDMTNMMMMEMPEDSMMEGATMLAPTTMMEEPAECTALRTSLRQFYIALAAESMMSADSM